MNGTPTRTHFLIVCSCLLAQLLFTPASAGQVTYDRLLHADKEPQNWLTYSGTYTGQRHSALGQINTSNVKNLVPKWAFQSGGLGKWETTPLVADGILYGTAQDNRAFALDARTGRPIWEYQYILPGDIRPCCGRVNRGFAMLGDKLYFATLDAHVLALDSRTGAVVWNVAAIDYKKGYSFTMAPLAVKNMIIVGVSGGEYGTRGFVEAYDAASGERKWRFYTTPGPGEPGHETWEGDSWKIGGAPAWITGVFDPSTNQLFWPTGNPAPSNRAAQRVGDNLYSNCLLALDVDTGKLNWYFQYTKHDEHDWDSTQVPVMIDLDGKKLIGHANRNGFFYLIDRTSGKLIFSKPFAHITWSKENDAEGRPVATKESSPTLEGRQVCPGAAGSTNWMSPSFDPQTKLFYVTAREQCDIFSTAPQEFEEGHAYYGSAYFPSDEALPYWGALRAIDPLTGERKWEFKHVTPSWSGVLTTAGGLVFTGDSEGNFIALDAATGKPLWHFQMGGSVIAAPMTFAVDGKQYVEITAGSTMFAFGLP